MFDRSRKRHQDSQTSAYIREITEQRRQKDHFFALSPQSPLPHAERHGQFTGLAYYAPDPAFRLVAEVVPFEQPEIVRMATSTGQPRPQARYAEIRFQFSGQQYRLFGFTDPHEHHTHELFVPFRDATSGRETYGAGRYLEIELDHHANGAHTAIIDFNLASNPYCAYSPDYSCPIPPPENTLPAAITAGERAYPASHHGRPYSQEPTGASRGGAHEPAFPQRWRTGSGFHLVRDGRDHRPSGGRAKACRAGLSAPPGLTLLQ
jgi:uncharacterized protein